MARSSSNPASTAYQAFSAVTGVMGYALNDSPLCVYMGARSLLCGMNDMGNVISSSSRVVFFYFQLPPFSPSSVTLQPAPGDTGKVWYNRCFFGTNHY